VFSLKLRPQLGKPVEPVRVVADATQLEEVVFVTPFATAMAAETLPVLRVRWHYIEMPMFTHGATKNGSARMAS
jgi:hypothetical protein